VKKEWSYFFIPPHFLINHRGSKETRKQDGTDSRKREQQKGNDSTTNEI
jgi:hypothetical protein